MAALDKINTVRLLACQSNFVQLSHRACDFCKFKVCMHGSFGTKERRKHIYIYTSRLPQSCLTAVFTGWFWRLPYLGMKLGQWQKCQKLHIVSLWGRNWAYFRSTGSDFQDTGRFSQLSYLGIKLGHWQRVPKVAHSVFVGSKLSLFSIYGSRFQDTGRFYKFPHLGMKPDIGKHFIRCVSTLFLPQGAKLHFSRSMGSSFADTGRFSKLSYLGMKPGIWENFQKLPMEPLSTPGSRNWAYFRSTGRGFSDRAMLTFNNKDQGDSGYPPPPPQTTVCNIPIRVSTTRKYIYNIPLCYHSISDWPWLWPFMATQGQIWWCQWAPYIDDLLLMCVLIVT